MSSAAVTLSIVAPLQCSTSNRREVSTSGSSGIAGEDDLARARTFLLDQFQVAQKCLEWPRVALSLSADSRTVSGLSVPALSCRVDDLTRPRFRPRLHIARISAALLSDNFGASLPWRTTRSGKSQARQATGTRGRKAGGRPRKTIVGRTGRIEIAIGIGTATARTDGRRIDGTTGTMIGIGGRTRTGRETRIAEEGRGAAAGERAGVALEAVLVTGVHRARASATPGARRGRNFSRHREGESCCVHAMDLW